MPIAIRGLTDEFVGLSKKECYSKDFVRNVAIKYGCGERTVRDARQKYLNSLPDDKQQTGIKEAADKFGVNESAILEVYFKDKEHTLRVRNPKHLPQAAANLNDLWKRLLEDVGACI